MHNEQIRTFFLQHKGVLISLSKGSSQEYIDQVNYLLDEGFLKNNGNSYIQSSKAVNFLAEADKKGLEIRILEYLKDQNTKANKIDIAAPFLLYNDSYDTRLGIVNSLTYLETEKFIELDGYPPSLCSKMADQFGSKFNTGIKASITKLGEKEIAPVVDATPIVHTPIHHNYNFEKSQTPIVNSTIQESFLKVDNSFDKQTNINSSPNKPIRKSWIEVLYWIAGIIVGGLLLYEFIIKHLRWV